VYVFQFCVGLLCLASLVNAQVAVEHWTTNNGLPLNSVSAICQSPEGYLWIATLDGLVRFDGERLVSFNRSNNTGIGGNRFIGMLCGANGGFWAASEGSGITEYRKGSFQTYTVRDGLLSNTIDGLSADARGNPWLLADGSISRWDPDSRRFVPLDMDIQWNVAGGFPARSGHAAFYRVNESGIDLIVHGERFHYSLPAGWRRSEVLGVAMDSERGIWIGSRTGKMARLLDDHWVTVSAEQSHNAPNEHAGFRSNYHDSLGNTWTIENEWVARGIVAQYLLLPGNSPRRIALTSLFEDREGSIWLTTDGDGLYRLRRQIIRVYSREQGLPDGNTYPVYQSKDGAIWIGTWSGGLSRFANGKFTTYTTANGLASNRVNSISEDAEGTLWVSVENGLHRLRKGRFETVTIEGVGGIVTAKAIHADREGVLWLGLAQGLFRGGPGHWTVLTRKDGLATEDIRVLIDARDGGIWAGGYGGLSWLGKGQVRAWTEKDGLPGNMIRALYEDPNGVLWIGTYDAGLGRFENGRFTKYTQRQGLFSNGVFQILEDSRANLWMSSNQGIYRVSKHQLNDLAAHRLDAINSIEYGRLEGMRNIECNGGLSPAGIKASDGRLWFPTQDGVAVIDPEHVPPVPGPPPVVMEACLIDHKPVAIDRAVRITPGQQNLEIQYTALSFINSEHIHFKYQLQLLDREWVEAGTRRVAYYPHLPPGGYTFHVTAAHSGGMWNATGATLSVIVLPAFYQTWWFASLVGLAAVTSIWLAWRYRVRQLERDHASQQAFSRQLIDSQENERKRIAAELHDSLGQRLVIINNRLLLFSRARDSMPALSRGQREDLEQISIEVSESMREVKEISYDLRPYRLDRLGLTVALRAMIETAGASGSTGFFAEIDDIDGVLPQQDEINFYRIVQECVNNILKHSEAAQATISIRRNGRGLTLMARDNGRGFTPGATTTSPLGGFGLTGISERAQLLGGHATFESAPGRGTTVTIEIKSGKLI
jgi:signal transduction histidine kinase/ligand-binding sensor domain-containing protein